MNTRAITFLLLVLTSFAFGQQDLQLKTANGHPIMYYVSLPRNWTPTRTWPVVFLLESAEKQFKENGQRFVEARGLMPFIIVSIVNTNNGNQGRKDPKVFPYSPETWEYIDRVGDCQFNADGIKQVMLDIQQEYNGESKIYLTGFEAGAHDLWSIVFNHPEYLKAAAPVEGNYRGRCVDAEKISKDPSRVNLPVMAFAGEDDQEFGPKGILYIQWTEAKDLAIANGYQRVAEKIVQGRGHEPMPKEVLLYFFGLHNKNRKNE